MKHIFTNTLLLLFVFGIVPSNAQLIDPNQPEQEPCNALEICGTFASPYSYQGVGTSNNLPTTPCGAGEDNSVWFKLHVNTSGVLVFRIVPELVTDDYDWALLNGTGKSCSSIGSGDVIRCNFNKNDPVTFGGQTGLNMTSPLISVAAGTAGSNFNKYVDVTAGETYYLMINNFGVLGAPTLGFTLDFDGSTATFNMPPAPEFETILPPNCNYANKITLKLTEKVKCSSITSSGSDFSLSPFGSIISAVGTDCSSSSGYTDEIVISFAGPLPPGTYTLNAKTGSDGNTLLNLCDVPLVLPESITFTVPKLRDTVEHTICDSQLPYTWNGITITAGGMPAATYTTTNSSGCDSVTVLNLNVVDQLEETVNITICTNQLPYTWNGIVLTAGGMGVATFETTSVNGCDSIATLNLTVTPPKEVTQTLELCSYELPYNWNGFNIPAGTTSTPGYAIYHTVTATGCDSFTTLNLVVYEANPYLEERDTSACGELVYNGVTYTRDTVIKDTVRSVNGCDSIYMNYNLTVHYNEATVETGDMKGCDSVIFNGITYTRDTVVVDSFPSIYGCDSFVRVTNILIHELELELNADPDLLVQGEYTTLQTSGNVEYAVLSWSPASVFSDQDAYTQTFIPAETAEYEVIAISDYGCRDTAKAKVEVLPLVPDFLMPSAFSPNGDGLNDVFRPKFFHETGYVIKAFHIYNRWGNLVYALENSRIDNAGWDGTYSFDGEPAKPDVYYYVIEVEFVNKQKVVKKGDVTLVK